MIIDGKLLKDKCLLNPNYNIFNAYILKIYQVSINNIILSNILIINQNRNRRPP